MTNFDVSVRQVRVHASGDRARIAALVAERASTAGRAPGGFLARLWSGSYASLAHRFVYVETPKVASTKIKYFVAELENATPPRDRRPYLPESRPVMLIHQRRDVQIPTVLDLPFADAQALFEGRSDYFVFALSRNPFGRLVSAYENKIRLCEPGYGESCEQWAAAAEGDDVRAAFIAFVREGLDTLIQRGEHHFVDQFEGVSPDILPYTRVFPCEQFDVFEQAFLDHLRAQGVEREPALRDLNRSHAQPWRNYYDAATAARVAEVYRRDFAAFGYDPQDWRPEGTVKPIVTSAGEARWRRAVIERNAMIELLYRYAPPPTASRLSGRPA